MATLYSHQFVNAQGISSEELDVPMPPGVLWVIRDVCVYRNNLTANTLTFALLDENVTWLAYVDEIDAQGSSHWEGRLVIPPGAPGGFKIVADGAGAFDVVVSGYKLQTP